MRRLLVVTALSMGFLTACTGGYETQSYAISSAEKPIKTTQPQESKIDSTLYK